MKSTENLEAIHKASGMTYREVLDKLREFSPEMPRTHPSLIYILKRGTDRAPVLRALAYAYGKKYAVIEAAATPVKDFNKNRRKAALTS